MVRRKVFFVCEFLQETIVVVCFLSLLFLWRKDIDIIGKTSSSFVSTQAKPDSSCDPFQIWPILNVEKEEAIQEEVKGGSQEETKEQALAPACSHIFRPFDFFHNQSSPGFQYLNHLKHLSVPSIIHKQMISIHHTKFTKATSSPDYDNEEDVEQEGLLEEFHLLYSNVPKAATTTILSSINDMNKKLQSSSDLKSTYHNTGCQEDEMKAILDEMEHEFKNASTSTLSPSFQKKFRHFGIMRDPVSRFVSATAQEMTIKTGREKAEQFRKKCLKKSAEETLKCAIRDVKERFTQENLYRVHYVPSAVLFYLRTLGRDVPIELIEFGELGGFLGNFPNPSIHENKQEEKSETGENDIVASMSVSDLSEDMIEEICNLYAVDVLIMRHLNMDDKYCEGYIFTPMG